MNCVIIVVLIIIYVMLTIHSVIIRGARRRLFVLIRIRGVDIIMSIGIPHMISIAVSMLTSTMMRIRSSSRSSSSNSSVARTLGPSLVMARIMSSSGVRLIHIVTMIGVVVVLVIVDTRTTAHVCVRVSVSITMLGNMSIAMNIVMMPVICTYVIICVTNIILHHVAV